MSKKKGDGEKEQWISLRTRVRNETGATIGYVWTNSSQKGIRFDWVRYISQQSYTLAFPSGIMTWKNEKLH